MSAPEDYVEQDHNPHPLQFTMPAGAIDAHMHVIGPFGKFPLSPKAQYKPFAATWQEQKEVLVDRMGFWGYVVVQATCHGTDNRVVVDALEHMEGHAAGVASVDEDITTEELKRLHAAGVRGVRFAFLPHIASETTPPDVIQRIAAKIQPFGWHTDLYFLPQTFEIMEPLIRSLPTPVLIDHMGRPDVNIPIEKNDYFQRLLELGTRRGDIYWKVTSPDRYTRSARPEDWAVALPFGHALIQHFPANVVSGTDRPRPNMNTVILTGRGDPPNKMPNDGDIANHWIWPVAHKDPDVLRRILVENPRKLYSFNAA
ncbi:MAG TPA: amidohydrolase family protein [Bryobacteraceae bacterium]|jgi:2-pyrone-4,6-dicarboxylate lactonase|nr:amidohydrolase family protein [Bryobacteraceae bacterium]